MPTILSRIAVPLILFTLVFSCKASSVDTLHIHSTILDEDRELIITIPETIEPSDSVSLIYMLDGRKSSYRIESFFLETGDKKIIGIGIVNTNRNRDLLEGKQADLFLRFITEEVIPFVEKSYTVRSRTLYGHSFGGGFTIYAMFNTAGVFSTFIASSPTPIMNYTDSEVYLALDTILKQDINFYFSYGSKDMRQVRKWNSKLIKNLESIELKHIDWSYNIFPNENHSSSAVLGLIEGLNYYF